MPIGRIRRVCKYPPSGTDFYKVLQEGKRCYKFIGSFAMVPYRISGQETIWTAEFNNVPPIVTKVGSIIYKYSKEENGWIKHRHIKKQTSKFYPHNKRVKANRDPEKQKQNNK